MGNFGATGIVLGCKSLIALNKLLQKESQTTALQAQKSEKSVRALHKCPVHATAPVRDQLSMTRPGDGSLRVFDSVGSLVDTGLWRSHAYRHTAETAPKWASGVEAVLVQQAVQRHSRHTQVTRGTCDVVAAAQETGVNGLDFGPQACGLQQAALPGVLG